MRLSLDDIEAHVEVSGDGSPIVLLHGAFMNTLMWQPQAELADQHKLITLDLRGHGKTPCPVTGRSFNRPRDIIQVLDHLQIKKAFFCGLSMGGPIALQLALDYPERCLGVILLATGPGPADRPLQATQEMKDNAGKEAQRLIELGPVQYFYASPTAVAPGVKEFLEQPAQRAFFERILANNESEYLADSLRLGSIDLPAKMEGHLTSHRRARLNELHKPVLFMVGSLDIPFSRVADFLRDTVPQTEIEVVDGASHLINMDSTEQVNARIRDFVRKVVDPQRELIN